MIAEDDFTWCLSSLALLFRALSAAIPRHFAALRVSYGNNGLVLHCADLPSLVAYSEGHKALGPLDSLLGNLLTGDAWDAAATCPGLAGRPFLVYRHNLMNHIGHLSVRQNGSIFYSPFELGFPVRVSMLLQVFGLNHAQYRAL